MGILPPRLSNNSQGKLILRRRFLPVEDNGR